MCGIAGLVRPGADLAPDVLRQRAAAMAARLAHRGPDDSGVLADAARGLALGFRRLAVQDVSPAGAQPMESACGRLAMVFNGEIYNAPDLRAMLEADGGGDPNIRWRGHSDTEVLLAAVARWGLRTALERTDGMFALAVHDRRAGTLSLARDRMGEKPLYHGWRGGVFAFASELRAVEAAAPGERPALCHAAARALVMRSHVPAPLSILRGFSKLPPGCLLTLPLDRLEPGATPEPEVWWDARAEAIAAARTPFAGDATEAAETLSGLLRESVRRRLISDVPLGAFLSGGIDSSLVTALAAEVSDAPVRTFTIGFEDPRRDEAPHARAVAERLGTRHTAHRATAQDALNAVSALADVYDEPFADISALPTLLLCRMARRDVTVALSGDGGDELFGGYPRLWRTAQRWHGARGRRMARPLWRALAARPHLFAWLNPSLPGGRSARLGDRAWRMARDMAAPDIEALHGGYLSRWQVAPPPCAPPPMDAGVGAMAEETAGLPPETRLMLMEATGPLPDQLLVKMDRASMSVGLEARAPLLSHEVARFAWSLPPGLLWGDGAGKLPLRLALRRHVPAALVERPKQGFEPPVGGWLRGPLREWAGDLLSSRWLAADGLLSPGPARAAHLRGRRARTLDLWSVLTLLDWRARTGI